MTDNLIKSPKKRIKGEPPILEISYLAIFEEYKVLKVHDIVVGDIGGLGKRVIQNIHLTTLPTKQELDLILEKNKVSYDKIHEDLGCPYIGFSKDEEDKDDVVKGIYVNLFCPRPELR